MKKLFKKAVTVLGSVALVGATVGGAAAAAYPVPFGTDYAVVYGASADEAAATTIAAGLPALGGTGGTVVGGDSYKFEKTSTKFHIGDGFQTLRTTLDEDELPVLLADGKFVDDDNDEFDYSQKVTIANNTLTMFDDDDYSEDDPTIGFKITSGTNVLNYTLTFDEQPLLADLVTTSIPMMDKEYYVLSNSTSGADFVLTLLDSATDTTLTEGEAKSLAVEGTNYDVSIDFISSTEVVLIINGETTNSLGESETYKLNDGSYVGVKDIRYNSKEGTVSSVEFSIGSGKLKLTSGSEVQINDESITGLTATITNSSGTITSSTGTLATIVLQWNAEDDLWITDDTDVTMPGFGGIKLSYGGASFPVEEVVEVKQGATTYAVLNSFPLKDGPADIPFLYGNASGRFIGIGQASDKKLITSNTTSITFDSDNDDWFIVSYAATSEGESYLMRATSFITESSVNKTNLQVYKNGDWSTEKTKVKPTDTFNIGQAELGISSIDKVGRSVTITANSSNTNFYHLYSKEGLRTYLPFETANSSVAPGAINFTDLTLSTTGHNGTSYYLNFTEEDKDGNIGSGDAFTVVVGWDASTIPEVQVSDLEKEDVTAVEIGTSDVFRSFMYSALATEFLWSKPSSGQNSIKIIYHGDEVIADVYITSPETTLGGGTGQKTFMADESSSYAGKNLIVVGGSCVNSVAASLLGGAYCAADFTGATTVVKGQFLIKTFDNGGKLATVVAGYDQEDTTKAATYLANGVEPVPEIAAGATYTGTSASESATRLV